MRSIIFILFLFLYANTEGQDHFMELKNDWQFSRAGTNQWYPAVVPGTIYTDLFRNKLIPDPFYSDNEKKLQWIDTCDWVYRTSFTYRQFRSLQTMELYFKGLDTYADIFVNGELVTKTENMFRAYLVDVLQFAKRGRNELTIYFHSAKKITDSIANAQYPLVRPDNNRVYARKAQFQFGWDWGPKFIGCGIWQPVYANQRIDFYPPEPAKNTVLLAKLIQKKDAVGESFYFEKAGKPVYIKGANWIPANIFLPFVTKNDYRTLLIRAKDAHMNMLRVWGGGVYEDDYFYDLCDSLGIMVWQDFMFAGGMYPADNAFMQNIKEEIKYQVNRLKRHRCIVLWCGNNEIDEAWHNWGWQGQFNIHGADSARLWSDYKKLFVDSLSTWVKEFDGMRSYIPSSPRYGWGHEESFTEGDSHYWGLWWGLEPWETFGKHTGRFVSEYGMQSMPNYETVKTYVPANELYYSSPAVQWHQKASEGFYKLNFYLDKYFIDSAKLKKLTLEEYNYLTQCLQYYILKNSIAVQRSKEPRNMGTLLWQLNDCWPVTSWSITDYSLAPKAGWFAVKEAYREDAKAQKDSIYPKNLHLQKPVFTFRPAGANHFIIESSADARYIYISSTVSKATFSDNYFNLKAGEKKEISAAVFSHSSELSTTFKIVSLFDILNK